MSDWQPPPPGADQRLPPMQEQPSQPQQDRGAPPGPGLGAPEPEGPDRSSAKILLVAGLGFGAVLFVIAALVVVWKLFWSEEAPTPSAATAATGSLVLASSPEGATVRLGDEVLGTTPLSQDVTPGEHELRFVKEGHEPHTMTANVEADEVVTITAKLEERVVVDSDETGTLTLETQPSVKVYMGDELLGETPLDGVEVPAGVVPLELELESGDRVTRAVYVKPNDVTKTYIDLSRGR